MKKQNRLMMHPYLRRPRKHLSICVITDFVGVTLTSEFFFAFFLDFQK